jgi:hypothetical protein
MLHSSEYGRIVFSIYSLFLQGKYFSPRVIEKAAYTKSDLYK